MRELPQVDYRICAITGDPNVKLKYDLMSNVGQVIHVPLWGAEEPAEFILPEVSFSEIYVRKQETTYQVIEAKLTETKVPKVLDRSVRASHEGVRYGHDRFFTEDG